MKDFQTKKEIFLSLENRFDLTSIQYKGLSYWVYSRADVFSHMNTGKPQFDISCYTGNLSIRRLLINALKRCGRAILHNSKVEIKETTIFSQTIPRCIYTDKGYINIYTDFLVREFGTIFKTEPYPHSYPQMVEPYYADAISFICFLWVHINIQFRTKRYKEFEKEIYDKLYEPITRMSVMMGVSADVDEILFIVLKNMLYGYFKKKKYQQIIGKIKPTIIIEVGGYSIEAFVMSEMAREKRIVSVEFQHGIEFNDSESIFYKYDTDALVKALPQYFFAFSEYEKQKISYPTKSTKVIATGFPYHDYCVNKYTGCSSNDKIILFLGGGTDGIQLSKIAAEYSSRNQDSSYRIIYKLHSGECTYWRNQYSWLNSSKIEVIDDINAPLYYYLAQADICVGGITSALCEAIDFTNKILVYNLEKESKSSELERLGCATDFCSLGEFIVQIERMKGIQKECNRNPFFQSDAKTRIINELKMNKKM